MFRIVIKEIVLLVATMRVHCVVIYVHVYPLPFDRKFESLRG